jgi:hydroxymethylglutaryl-CoA synthase
VAETKFGISGFALSVPPYRVQLKDWCDWTSNSWDKTRAVIGNSFRVVGAEQSVYTMAANAVLALIDQYNVDPQCVGYLALGTESGTDNATSGAVVVRGLVDGVLRARGRAPLARDLETPEYKQACLGGVYGIKGALRYLAVDGRGRVAIVVAADIAEYARGSSGEPTQGAGAVAMLLEADPRLLAIDLRAGGNASSYRALDFRKPFLRFCGQQPGRDGRPRDFPVFNGRYSTACYIDETVAALGAFFAKRAGGRRAYMESLGAVFMHRPYHRMPVAAWAMGYLFALGADGGPALQELAGYAATAGVDPDSVLAEMRASRDLLGEALAGQPVEEPYPLTARLIKPLRDSACYAQLIEAKMALGCSTMLELGNLYSGALPAWMAAGIEEALLRGLNLDGQDWLLIGYGSGDAAEVLPATVVPGWQDAARRIRLGDALSQSVDLKREQYEALHDGHEALLAGPVSGYVVDRVGSIDTPKFQDLGVEYYRYVG